MVLVMSEDEYAILYHHVRGKNIERIRYGSLFPAEREKMGPGENGDILNFPPRG